MAERIFAAKKASSRVALRNLSEDIYGAPKGINHIPLIDRQTFHDVLKAFSSTPAARDVSQMRIEAHFRITEVGFFHALDQVHGMPDYALIEGQVTGAAVSFARFIVEGDTQSIELIFIPIMEYAAEKKLRDQQLMPVDLRRKLTPGRQLISSQIVQGLQQ